MKRSRIFALCVIMVLGIAGLASASITRVSPLDVYERMELESSNPDYIGYLIDIRTPEEWCGGDYYDSRTGKMKWTHTAGHPFFGDPLLDDRVINISYKLWASPNVENDLGRIDNPWFEWEFTPDGRYSSVPDEPFALMCATGKRSYGAADDLDILGLRLGEDWDIYNVVGGFKGRDCGDTYCFEPFCMETGKCTGWKEGGTYWSSLAGADVASDPLPRSDFYGEHVDPWEYQDPNCPGAYQPVPIPGTVLLLGSGLFGIFGILRRRFVSIDFGTRREPVFDN